MVNKQQAVLVLTGAILASAVVYGAVNVYAQEISDYPLIIQRLVERFNLDPAQVQEVFTGVREERMIMRQANFGERLTQAVEEGKISEEQKQAILEKKAEMREKHEELKGLSPEERRQAMEQFREEMKVWADGNGITPELLFGLRIGIMRGGCIRGGFHGGFVPW